MSALMLGWLAPLIASTTPLCQPQLQIAADHPVAPWFGFELAAGGRLQETLDVQISGAERCPPMAIGVETTVLDQADSSVIVRATPNGPEIGFQPAAQHALLPVAVVQGRAALLPVLQWSAHGVPFDAGTARVRLRWHLYDRTSLFARPLAEAESWVSVHVPAVLNVEIAAAGVRTPLGGTQMQIDLGELRTGDRHTVSLEVRGNSAAQISVDRRWGTMRNPDRPDWTIPYALSIDGQPLRSGSSIRLNRSGGVSRAELGIHVGEVAQRAAGRYEETLTLTVAAE